MAFDDRPRDLSKYQIKRPHFEKDRFFFLYDDFEDLERPGAIEQPTINQHQLVFSESPNFWTDDKVLDSMFSPIRPSYGHGLTEYPGSSGKGHLFVKAWSGTYALSGELPFRFPDDEYCQTLYVRGRARWFFANVNSDGGQMGGTYPTEWSPWSDTYGLQTDHVVGIERTFKPGTPGIYWWKRSDTIPDLPAERIADKWEDVKGWRFNEIEEDDNPNTPPVWRMTRWNWMENQTKKVSRKYCTEYVIDYDAPMKRKWECTNLISVDPAVKRNLQLLKEQARARERERIAREREEERERRRRKRIEAEERNRKYQEQLKKDEAASKKRQTEERARAERQKKKDMHKGRIEMINWIISPYDKAGKQQWLSRVYNDDQYNDWDEAIRLVAQDLKISL